MGQLNWRARAYVLAVMASAMGLWLGTLVGYRDAVAPSLNLEALAFLLATIIGEFTAVPLPRGGLLSLSTITQAALALLFPPPVAMCISATAMGIEQMSSREPWYRAGFNMAANALAIGISGLVLRAAGSGYRQVLETDDWRNLVILLVFTCTYYVVNVMLTYIVVSLSVGRSLRSVVVGNGQYAVIPELGMVVVGQLLALLWVWRPIWSLAIILPALVTHRSLKVVRRLQIDTENAVMALADIVDSRDSSTYHHSRRVAIYAGAIARELDLDASDIDLLVSAARVHDLGKIAVPDSVLLKPGRLTEPEWEMMRAHPSRGAEILGRFDLYQAGMRLARHHHEWYNGAGYPSKLAGKEIPLGARVLAVADSYDAMTSDRPYRSALSQDEALRRLEAGQGTQFDPVAVGAMVRLATRGELAAVTAAEQPVVEGHAQPIPGAAPVLVPQLPKALVAAAGIKVEGVAGGSGVVEGAVGS